MQMRRWGWVVGLCLSSAPAASPDDRTATSLAQLGEALFFDEGLSTPAGRSCASCHAPGAAFTDPERGQPTSEGAVPGRFGARNAPTVAYAQFSPPFRFNAEDGTYEGGQFLDGRARTLEEQATGPLLNPQEMNNASKAEVVAKVRRAPYAWRFVQLMGPRAFDDVEGVFDTLARAIAAFERTPRFAPFTSKYDAWLAGRTRLSPLEARGLALFNAPSKGNCAACHPSTPSADGTPPLFTDFTYDNLGIPPSAARQGRPTPGGPVDLGLGGVLRAPAEAGKFKVPTLRNIAVSGPYMHDGSFRRLEDVVHFYNTRDTLPWPPPEVPETVNREELGNLGLTDAEEAAIVAFLRTLTDGWQPEP